MVQIQPPSQTITYRVNDLQANNRWVGRELTELAQDMYGLYGDAKVQAQTVLTVTASHPEDAENAANYLRGALNANRHGIDLMG
jgi:hypothetical protein